MDAITIYEYYLVDGDGNQVTDPSAAVAVDVTLTSEYAAGGIIQHSGYIISGSTADGTYLEVRDIDTGSGSDPDYFLDTPPGVGPNTGPADTAWDDNAALPLTNTRRFTPGSGATVANLLENPLFYAAKWGGFEDADGNDMPNQDSEWDKDNDGCPTPISTWSTRWNWKKSSTSPLPQFCSGLLRARRPASSPVPDRGRGFVPSPVLPEFD